MTPSPSSPKRSGTPDKMEIPPTTDVVDLTLDSDDEDVSEISRSEFIDSEPIIKSEPQEPVGISCETLELTREAEREVIQSIEEVATSVPKGGPATPRAISRATPAEAAGHGDADTAATVAEDVPGAFIPPRPIAPPPMSREELIARDRELEDMLRSGIINFHAREDQNQNSNPPSAAQQSNNSNSQSTPARTPLHLDNEAEDAAAAANFQKLKKRYEYRRERDEATFSEEIEFKKASQAEENRIRLRQKKRAYAEREAQNTDNDETLFCSDNERSPRNQGTDFPANSPGGDSDIPAPKKAKSSRANKIPPSALQESMRVGLDASNAQGNKRSAKEERKRKESTKKVSADKVKKSKGKKNANKVPKKKGRPRRGPEITNIGSLLNYDLIAEAQANQDKPDAPGFTSHVRKDALKELIASMPADQQKLYTADRNAIDQACRSFSGVQSIKAKGTQGWLLKGMTSCLKNYQLLGTAFMRERENCGRRPFGGIQSDDMGLGKTVMMIANILDGKASDRSPNRSTLVVCPAALTTQWMEEIGKHTEKGALGEVIVYRTGSRIVSSDPVRTLSNADVVITTYQEVLRSYPHCESPLHIVSEEAKQRWWAAHYEEERGVLHRIFWRRIVLDEGHLIKNHMSKTSVAVRGLSGKYRWAITGTPVQNSLAELFPYFAFLKVEHTGSFETFKRNFCKKGSALAMERLKVYLQTIMVRRTHVDQMFGAPILKLPKINQQTIEVEFNPVERAIYRIVKTRFISKIKAFAKADAIDKKFQQIFTLLLRLRQLAGHILLIAKTLKELLAAEDLERLWKLTENEGEVDEANRDMLKMLKRGLNSAAGSPHLDQNNREQETRRSHETDTHTPGIADAVENNLTGPSFRFRKYLKSLREDGRWEKIVESSLCHYCGSVSKNPHITSCMHVYCLECLEAIAYSAAQQDNIRATCKECGTEYEKVEPCRGFEEAAQEDGSPVSVRSAGRKRKKSDSEDEDADWFTVGGPVLRSAKTKAAEAQIEAWLADDPDAKIIVFTQFIGMLKVMSRICAERNWGHTLFHGGMTFDSRDSAIRNFSKDPETKLLLSSLKAGGLGLNLTAASRVIIIDLWWNQSVELQSFARVYRIGQTRDVELRRFVVKDSVDTDILKMQERKNTEIGVVAERRDTKLTTQEMLRLFGPLTTDEDGEITADGEDEPFIFVADPHEAHDSDSDIEELPMTIPARPF